ncbi:MAG TPA: tetratricopeptide repeat protein [Streptosporangiales bacterium]
MADLPTGTITLLFSDMAGSTRLLAQLGDAYADALSAQRSILRAAFARRHGVEMGTEGDSFFVVFGSAVDAVGACVEGQRALAAHPWPQDVRVRVRMGLHTGEPRRHEDGYIGMDVHRAARIAAAAHGGQVVLSAATHELVAAVLRDVGFRDLGWHRLKDITEPEHVYQLDWSGTGEVFPPLKSLGTRTNLPALATQLVGRDADLAELTALLDGEATRLVTLTGPGGVGKSRLAVALADRLAADHPDGVYFVRLASVTEPDVMWTTIAETLGVSGDGRSPPTFFEHIAQRQALFVLDNLEQIPAAAGVVTELLRAGSRLRVVATSRRPLHVLGEHEYPVATLGQPEPGHGGVDEARDAAAVRMFVQHAQMVRPDFTLDETNVADVTAICRRLDGLPLALEIAGARSKLLGPRALLARLDDALEFRATDPDRPGRQRTLRDTIAWSYHLLSPELQRALRSIACCAGGCEMSALSAILPGGLDPLETVTELVDLSLLTVRDGYGGEPRIGMLQTVRAFAERALVEAGEADAVRWAHARYFLRFAERIAPGLQGADPVVARNRLEAELDNLRAALDWSLRSPGDTGADGAERTEAGLQLCQALSWFWYGCGYTAEGRSWQRRALRLVAERPGPAQALVLHGLAILLLQQGDTEEAVRMLRTCLSIWRQEGDRTQIAKELSSLGAGLWTHGDADQARPYLEESIAVAGEIGDDDRSATALSNLGVLELHAGHADRAVELLTRAQAFDERTGNTWGLAVDRENLVAAMLSAGRPADAMEELRELAPHIAVLGDVELTINVIELYVSVLSALGDHHRAARVFGAAESMREQASMPIAPLDAEFLDRYLDATRAALTPEQWRDELRRGRGYDVAAALADAALADAAGAARPAPLS